MNRYCKDCQRQVVMHTFSFGECLICKDEVSTGHIPCHKLCEECSEDFNLCEQCAINEII